MGFVASGSCVRLENCRQTHGFYIRREVVAVLKEADVDVADTGSVERSALSVLAHGSRSRCWTECRGLKGAGDFGDGEELRIGERNDTAYSTRLQLPDHFVGIDARNTQDLAKQRRASREAVRVTRGEIGDDQGELELVV